VELVSWQYSGDEHDVIKGIGIVNLLFKESESGELIPMDYRIRPLRGLFHFRATYSSIQKKLARLCDRSGPFLSSALRALGRLDMFFRNHARFFCKPPNNAESNHTQYTMYTRAF
jgi:hypothetical protein